MDYLDILMFVIIIAVGVLLYLVLTSFKRKHWAYFLLVIAYELTAYVFAEFLMPYTEDDYQEFNDRVFIAFNLIGLIAIIVLVARYLLKTKDSGENNKPIT